MMSYRRQQLLWLLLQLALMTTKIHAVVITCYVGTWAVYREGDGKFQFEDIDPFKCTHLIYSFVGINDDGTIKILDDYLDIQQKGYEKFNALKQRNPQLKTLVSIGGWNADSKVFSNVVSNPSLRENLKRSALDFLRTHKFDGFDLDWEYPAQRGGEPSDKENFAKLLEELSGEFNSNGFLLTAAVSAVPNSVDISYDVPALSKYLHYIHVMTYDLHGTWDKKTGENAPLYPSSVDVSPIEKTLNVNDCIRGWIEKGADRGKIVMGLAAYGRSFTLTSPDQNGIGAPITGPGKAGPITKEEGNLAYNEICRYLADGGWTTVWNNDQRVPYAFNGDQWVGYDNPDSIKQKVDVAKELNLGGAMIWSVENDDYRGRCGKQYPILSAVNEAYGRNKRKHRHHHATKKHLKHT